MEKISVVIPTYNRYKFLLNAIKSIKNQTYKNLEIIVVNDRSSEKEYYSHDWVSEGVKMIHLEKNTKEKFGFACAGYVRNQGINASTGKYVAFCDDDDIWLPEKLEKQMDAILKTGCKMSSTEGYIGKGVFQNEKTYKKYNSEHYFQLLQRIFLQKGYLLKWFPKIWTLEFLLIHNCMITSSVLIERDLLLKIKGFRCIKNGHEDYDCWVRLLFLTKSAYVNEPCFYYDNGHGEGQNY